MVLEAGLNPIETIKRPWELYTMLKTVLYPKNYDSVSDWIPDVGDGRVLKEPTRNVPNDANEDRMRAIAPNTIVRVGRAENASDAKLEITNLQLYIPVITPSIQVKTRIFNSLTKDIEIAFLRRNTVGSMTLTGESTTWPITNTIKPARYLMVGFKNLPDSQTNNNNIFRVAMNRTQDPLIHKIQVRLNNDNYLNQPLTINPTTKDYNELCRNYKTMCELFGNSPQFEYLDFAINHPIFCFDLSAHQEDLFKTGVNINIHIKKTQGNVTGYCLLLE
ncbi:hypothetical protein LOTGIDRAFT_162621 [Lottia gigantea]|uniref:Uncharacterized protein n=1 Tax=Lottia gigantea TaxID=225164 RepID=V3ZLS9_LOTGI|nr:hypothetical protein LOTGIDRAFT_162621 [Lottia gigantea]ESO92318.1 hypothetical protein LOTGIDRAFT_162621 [Lottia gigantea]